MVFTRDNIGIKGMAKNLTKFLHEHSIETSHSASLNTVSRLAGYSNFNTYSAEAEKQARSLEKNSSSMKKISGMVDLINKNTIKSLAALQLLELMVESLNNDYESYIDNKGRYLNFTLPLYGYNDVKMDEPFIVLEKKYFGGRNFMKNEHVFFDIKDSGGFPSLPSAEEIEPHISEFKPSESKYNNLSLELLFDIKNPSSLAFETIYINHSFNKNKITFKKENKDGNFNNDGVRFSYNGKTYDSEHVLKEQIIELSQLAQIKDTFAYQQYITYYEGLVSGEIKDTRNLLSLKEALGELDGEMFKMIIETIFPGIHSGVYQMYKKIISGFTINDIHSVLDTSFFNTYKADILNKTPVRYAVEAKDIAIDVEARDNY